MAMIIYEPKKFEKNMWAASFMSEEVANKKVLQYEHVTLTNREIHLLKGPRFLNDIIIEFFFLHLSNDLLHLHESFRDDILLVSPTLSYFLQQEGEDHIVDFVKSHGVTTKQIVIFTVNNNPDGGRNDGGSHWSLLVYYRKHDTFVHYDSLGNNGSFARKLYRAVKKHVGEAPPESETTNEDGDPNSINNDTSTINGINGVDGSNSTSLICGESSINETNGVGDSTSLMCGDSSTNEINGVGDSNSTRVVEGDSGVSEEKAAEKNGDNSIVRVDSTDDVEGDNSIVHIDSTDDVEGGNSIVHVDSTDDVEGGNSIVHVDSTDDVEGDNPTDIEKYYHFRGGWYRPEEEMEEEFRWRPWCTPWPLYYQRTPFLYDQRRKRGFSYWDRDCDGNRRPFYRRNNIDENFKEEICMPRQKNYYDCGLYVMRIAEVICEWYYSDEDTKRKEPQHGFFCQARVDNKGWFPNINGHMDTSVESTMRRDILEIIQQRSSEAGIVLDLFSEDDDDPIDTLLQQLSDDTKDVKAHEVSVELDDKTPLPQVSSGYLNDSSDDKTPLPQPQQYKSDDETIEDCGDICGEKDVALPPQQEQCMSDDDETL